MRITTLATLALIAAPLGAQQATKAPEKKDAKPTTARADKDPTREVAGAGLPAGWHARFDKPNAVAPMGGGYHVTSGPAAIYWDAKNSASGNYTISASFTQTKAPTHPEAYGLFVDGKALQGPNQSYAYLLVRGDGKYMIKHRASDTELHTIQDWIESPAVNKANEAGQATNKLSIAVGADSVRMSINGTQVFAKERSYMGPMNGFYGYRVNHNLDVHATAITLVKQ